VSPLESTWPKRLVFRAIAISLVAMFTAIFVQMTALVRLNAFAHDMALDHTASARWVRAASRILPLFPLPAIILGALAMGLRPFRSLLAVLSALAAVGGVVLVVGTLGLAMAPLYTMPEDPGVTESLRSLSAPPPRPTTQSPAPAPRYLPAK